MPLNYKLNNLKTVFRLSDLEMAMRDKLDKQTTSTRYNSGPIAFTLKSCTREELFLF